MRRFIIFILFTHALACNKPIQKMETSVLIDSLIQTGAFIEAENAIIANLADSQINTTEKLRLNYQLDLMQRIKHDFKKSEFDIRKELAPYYPTILAEQLQIWEKSKLLEMRFINGEKRYFSRAVGNLFRLDSAARERKIAVDGELTDQLGLFINRYAESLYPLYRNKMAFTGDIRKTKITYTLTVKPDVVPPGEIIRCWLPYPATHPQRQIRHELLSVNTTNYIISPDSAIHKSLYLEKIAVKNQETVFKVSFIVYTAAQKFSIGLIPVKPYNKLSDLYLQYTAEQLPHIVFSDTIQQLAKNIVGNESDPAKMVEKIYAYINTIPWAGALEYSIIDCIPHYVLSHKKGDCGMQTFMLLSLLRSSGIPARWQSGWYFLPVEINMHDWAEVYFEGIGWVPVDPSFKLLSNNTADIKTFYIGGLDSYRLIVNTGFGAPLFPIKIFPRSEPFDFQRGEVEWRGGNLYFDTWNYDFNVEYID